MSHAKRTKRTIVVAAAVAVTAALGTGTMFAISAADTEPPNDKTVEMEGVPTVPGSYIVVFDDTVAADAVGSTAADLAARHGATVAHEYSATISGFSMRATPEQAEKLAEDGRVKYVQPNQQITVDGS